jgi:hypothetical protein
MMHACGINKSTTKKTSAPPRLQVEDPFDKTFRPESGESSHHREKSGPESDVKSSNNSWEIDLAAFNEVELDSLLSAMSDNYHSAMRTEGTTLQSVGQGAASMVSQDTDDDEQSWVMGAPVEDEEVDWEVISNSDDSVISLVSNAMIPWTYKDALTLGKGSEPAMDRGETCSGSESCSNLPPIVDIHMRSASKSHQTSGPDEEFDADFVREGVKSARGGRTARMFKGNYPPKKKQTKAVSAAVPVT